MASLPKVISGKMGLLAQSYEVFAHLKRTMPCTRIQAVVGQIVMTPNEANQWRAPYVSIAIFAWNEERAIGSTLQSLFQQSLFGELRRRNLSCEVFCVTNGCTDSTPVVAAGLFGETMVNHPDRVAIACQVANIVERGKVNAWNQFVHRLSAANSAFLFMMDADILIHRKETFWNMLVSLADNPEAAVAVDVPCKDIAFAKKRAFGDRLSLAASRMTQAADGQLCGQLYCIRSQAARKIYMPKDLSACEDGFIKAMVCTDFLAHAAWPKRICVAQNAEHTFEAYTSPSTILKNQKRQIMGQTMVHVLVDQYLNTLPAIERQDLAQFLRTKDAADPFWLKRLITEHLSATRFFWCLYPGLLSNRFTHLRRLGLAQRLCCWPAALAGSSAALIASFMAYRSLTRGAMDYWPKASRAGPILASPGSRKANAAELRVPVALTRNGRSGMKENCPKQPSALRSTRQAQGRPR
jgi:hypothetical protein